MRSAVPPYGLPCALSEAHVTDGECDIVLFISTGFKQQATSLLAPKF